MLLNQIARIFRPSTISAVTNALRVCPPLAHSTATQLRWSGSSAVAPLADKTLVDSVNRQVETGTEGRLFAVVQVCGKQFKITTGDIVIVEGYWPPENGDRIRLDKVLLAGGQNFSLIGKPLLAPGLVDVQATVIEKTLSHTRTHFRKKRRKQYMRINFYRTQQTMLRINSIDVTRKLSDDGSKQLTEDHFF